MTNVQLWTTIFLFVSAACNIASIIYVIGDDRGWW